jgi:teichoic acid transport system permease protein
VPTLIVYAAVHLGTQLPIGPHLLVVILVIGIVSVCAAGTAMIFAALQVYFRDTSTFLPYFTRIWLYPVARALPPRPDRVQPASLVSSECRYLSRFL